MKRRSKKLLLTFVIALLVLAALGWSIAAGMWPAINRQAERRLVEALNESGFTSSVVPLRELTWKHAEAGPVTLEIPGVAFRIEHARAELGWAVWREQGALDFTLRGARVVLDLARLDGLRAWRERQAETGEGKSRDFSFDVAEGVVELRHGELRREVGFAGRVRWAEGKLSFETRLSAPELRAELVLTPEGQIKVANGAAKPEAWRELLAAVAPGEAERLRSLNVDSLELSGTADLAAGTLGDFNASLRATSVAWIEGDREFRGETVFANVQRTADRIRWQKLGAIAPRVRWDKWRLASGDAEIEQRDDSWRVILPSADFTGDGVRAQTYLEFEATGLRAGWPASAKVKLAAAHLASGGLTWTSELVSLAWDGRVVQLDLPHAELTAPFRASLSALKITVREPTSEQPVADGSVQLSAESAALFQASGWELAPAQLDLPVSFQASLARGQESVRATAKLDSRERRVRWPGGEITGTGTMTLTTTFDREFVSGRVQVEGRDWTARVGERELTAAKGDFSLRWPRTWWAALRDWPKHPRERLVRELLWTGDADLNFSDAKIAATTLGDWNGVSLRARVRGAEFSGESGIDVGFSADEGAVAGIRIRDVQVQTAAGFDQARVELAGNPSLLPVRVSSVQQVSWNEGLTSRGEFTVPEFDLAAAQGLDAWLPWIAQVERSGKVSGSATTAWQVGKLEASAAVKLTDGVFANAELGARCEGVQADLKFTSFTPLATDGLQKIAFERAKLSGVELTNGRLDLALLPAGRLKVGEASFDAFGGKVQAGNFETPLDRLEVKTLVFVNRVRLEQVSALFPGLEVKISGPATGAMPLEWRDGRMEIGSGVLDLVPGELATVNLPEKFAPLTSDMKPSEMGYYTLKKVEKAILELHANRLHVETYPANAKGQSVLIRMVGAPAGTYITAPVHLDFNVYAPLTSLVDWSMKGDFAVEGVR